MFRHLLIIMLTLISVEGPAQNLSKTFRLRNSAGLNKEVKVHFTPQDNQLLITTGNHVICMSDCRAIISMRRWFNNRFLIIEYVSFGGSGISMNKMMCVELVNNELIQNFAIISRLYENGVTQNGSHTKAIERDRTIHVGAVYVKKDRIFLALQYRESNLHASRRFPPKSFSLKYNASNRLFYNSTYQVKQSKDFVHGDTTRAAFPKRVPAIKFTAFTYAYINGEWYLLNVFGHIYRVSLNCN